MKALRWLNILAAVTLVLLASNHPSLPPLLLITALTQLADALIHTVHGNIPMIFGALVLTAIPAGHAIQITRSRQVSART